MATGVHVATWRVHTLKWRRGDPDFYSAPLWGSYGERLALEMSNFASAAAFALSRPKVRGTVYFAARRYDSLIS